MTPWHAAMQVACAAAGFDTEYAITLEGTPRKLDAYHAGSNLCLEFVSSLSHRYAEKHRQLIRFPIQTAWVFNSGARFATSAHEERIDVAALASGVIRVQNLFREDGGAREIIEEIGRPHCYTLHRGLVFGCVGYDLWECLPLSNSLQSLCVRDRGFNFQLFAFGKFPKRNISTGETTGEMRVVRSRYPLPSGHFVDPEHLLDDLRREVATGRLQRASALAVTTKPQSTSSDVSDGCVKLPSDNDVVPCDGDRKNLNASTNNLAIEEVAAQIKSAKATFDGVEFQPWEATRNTDVTIDDPVPVVRRQIRVFREDAAARSTERDSYRNVNKELQSIASSRSGGLACCGKRMVVVRNVGKVHWNECLSCGAISQSWLFHHRRAEMAATQ